MRVIIIIVVVVVVLDRGVLPAAQPLPVSCLLLLLRQDANSTRSASRDEEPAVILATVPCCAEACCCTHRSVILFPARTRVISIRSNRSQDRRMLLVVSGMARCSFNCHRSTITLLCCSLLTSASSYLAPLCSNQPSSPPCSDLSLSGARILDY
jgi:hypothetical protein